MNVPLLYIAFNRPKVTDISFSVLKAVKPSKLFLAVDGARLGRADDDINCAEVKKILSDISWKCDVFHLYHDANLGCGMAVCTAIDWFFSHVDSGIIMEDDLVAETSFFPFCEQLLELYRDDLRVMMISGLNILGKSEGCRNSYLFSRYGSTTGWATWKRAWLKNDFHLKNYKLFRDVSRFRALITDSKRADYIQLNLNSILRDNRKDIWDYQWEFSKLIHAGLSIVPSHNLMRNIGFGSDATHTKSADNMLASLTTEPVSFPLTHPPFMYIDELYDLDSFREIRTNGKKSILKNSVQPRFLLPEYSTWPWKHDEFMSNKFNEDEKWPMISIVLISLNEPELLELAIRSIIFQGYPELQLVIIDRGSDNETLETISKYSRYINYIRSYSQIGVSEALNLGLQQCRGVIFNWITPGNYYHSDSFKIVATYFIKNDPDILLLRQSAVDQEGNSIENCTTIRDSVEDTILVGNMIQASTFWRRDVFQIIGDFDQNIDYNFHLEAWFKYLLIYGQQRILIRPDCIVSSVVNLSTSESNDELCEKEKFSIYHSLFSFMKMPTRYLKVVENLVDRIRIKEWPIKIYLDEQQFIQRGLTLLSLYFIDKENYLMADQALAMTNESPVL